MAKKKKGGEHEGGDERWLITYADLITLLLGLFVVLWTMGLADLEKYGRIAEAMKTVFGGQALVPGLPTRTSAAGPYPDADGGSYPDTSDAFLSLRLEEAFEDIGDVAGEVGVEIQERGVVVHLTETVLFDLGRANIRDNAKAVLRELASVLVKSGRPIRVEGHTDNIPISTIVYPSNWQLSAARAANVVYFLSREAKLVPEAQLSIGAYADQKPIDSNETADGRQRNRRVDIVFMKGRFDASEARN